MYGFETPYGFVRRPISCFSFAKRGFLAKKKNPRFVFARKKAIETSSLDICSFLVLRTFEVRYRFRIYGDRASVDFFFSVHQTRIEGVWTVFISNAYSRFGRDEDSGNYDVYFRWISLVVWVFVTGFPGNTSLNFVNFEIRFVKT